MTLTLPITFLLCHPEAILAALIGIYRDFAWRIPSWGEDILNDDIDDASWDE